MNRLLITGASGALGGLTIEALLQRVEPDRIAALVRDSSRAQALKDKGVDVRQGDYFDLPSLIQAFEGIDKILLISTVAFTDRLAQHLNVISAARTAGVRHIVYTSIQRKEESDFAISMVTESDRETEQALKDSGLAYTILRNGLYLDVLPFMLGPKVLEQGVYATQGGGKAAMVSRIDLAQANAVVLTQAGHENATYTLGASQACSFDDIAAELSAIGHKPVACTAVELGAYVGRHVAAGLPAEVAHFLGEWSQAVTTGEFCEVTYDLERVLGRSPMDYRGFLRQVFGSGE